MGAIPALIGAGAGIIEGFLGQNSAKSQRDYETKMANSQYQRGTADMQKAGLNPALMYGSAGPAPTPSVGMAGGIGAGVDAVSSALQAKQWEATDAQAKASYAQAFKTRMEGLVAGQDAMDADVPAADSGKYSLYQKYRRAVSDNLSSAAALNRANLPGAQVTGSKAGGYIRMLQGPINSAVRASEMF